MRWAIEDGLRQNFSKTLRKFPTGLKLNPQKTKLENRSSLNRDLLNHPALQHIQGILLGLQQFVIATQSSHGRIG